MAARGCCNSYLLLIPCLLLFGYSVYCLFTPDLTQIHNTYLFSSSASPSLLRQTNDSEASPPSLSALVLEEQSTLTNSSDAAARFVDEQQGNDSAALSPELPPVGPPLTSLDDSVSENQPAVNSTVVKKKTSVQRIEEDLVKARAAIRTAALSPNYTADKEDAFVPRGSIYRNAAAFYRSHKEMLKRFKVWTYREGEQPIFRDGPVNDIYGIEGQFIDEMSNGKSPFLAAHPDQAHAFFIPFSVANVVHYVYKPIRSVADFSRDRLQHLFEDYVDVLARKYPYWNHSNGADHFMVSCHDWSPSISYASPELFKNFIRGLCNANMSEGFRPHIDISIPEIYLPKGQLGPRSLGQPPGRRTIFAFFAGREHGGIRKILFKHWLRKDDEVQVYDGLQPGQDYTKMMGQSKFCLCPSGWEVASPREVEAIYAGCVPVVISDNYSLPFNDVLNWDEFSLQIPVSRIPDIKTILKSVSDGRYLRMQRKVAMVKKHFMVNRPAKPYDVMHMILHSIWLRRLNIRIST